jgi:hypothetical protein
MIAECHVFVCMDQRTVGHVTCNLIWMAFIWQMGQRGLETVILLHWHTVLPKVKMLSVDDRVG